jgi:hypothetical protein
MEGMRDEGGGMNEKKDGKTALLSSSLIPSPPALSFGGLNAAS